MVPWLRPCSAQEAWYRGLMKPVPRTGFNIGSVSRRGCALLATTCLAHVCTQAWQERDEPSLMLADFASHAAAGVVAADTSRPPEVDARTGDTQGLGAARDG